MAKARKFTLNQCLAAVATVAVLHAGLLDAAGLGRLNVLSQMGQPFVGEIDLVNVTRDDLSTMQARLAPAAAYQAANLRFDPALNSLRFSVQQRPNGTAYLRATTTRPIAEPYLDLVVELTSQSGKFQRQYSALLDPPGLTEAPAAAASGATAATSASPAPAVPTAPAARPARPPAPIAAAPLTPAPAQPAVPVPAPPRAVAVPAAPPPARSDAVAPAPPKPAVIPKVEPVAPKPEAVAPKPEAVVPKPEAVVTKPDAAKPPAEASAPATEAPKAPAGAKPEGQAVQEPPATPAAPAPATQTPQPQAPAATTPSPRGFVDSLMDNLLPVGGALALLAGLIGWWAARRRKGADDATPQSASVPTHIGGKTEPHVPSASSVARTTPATPAAAPAPAVASAPVAAAAVAAPSVANVTDMVDPLEEAQVYLDHGADEQAQDVLRKALVKEPQRQDVQLKLLEILAAHGDKAGFNQLAARLREQTGGAGATWERVVTLGAALDPGNTLYPAAGPVAQAAAKKADDPGLDFDLGAAEARHDPLANTTAMLLGEDNRNLDMEKTMVLPRAEVKAAAPPANAGLDFNFELPPASAPAPEKPAPAPARQDDSAERGLDFKIHIPEVNLNLDDKHSTTSSMFEVKSPQWEEVQQKFDLVLAYKEMGDKDGMLEALQEIDREGDAAQKARAQKMIEELKAS